MDPSMLPSMVRSSLLMMRPSTRSAFPIHAATRRSVNVGVSVGDDMAHYVSIRLLDTDSTSTENPRRLETAMKRALCGLVLVIQADNSVRASGAGYVY